MTFIASHESGTVLWHLAQLSFSLMLSVAFTASGGYGMPFLAVGLWKCVLSLAHHRASSDPI